MTPIIQTIIWVAVCLLFCRVAWVFSRLETETRILRHCNDLLEKAIISNKLLLNNATEKMNEIERSSGYLQALIEMGKFIIEQMRCRKE